MTVKELYRRTAGRDGETVELSGWARTVRSSKSVGFIELNDGTFFKNAQIVFAEDLENFQEIAALGPGTALRIRGELALTPQARQPFEVRAAEVEIVGGCPGTYPLQKKRHSMEYLRSIAHLRPRTNTFSAVFRVRSVLAQAIHRFFADRGFVYVHTPIITASDCEGAGEMFRVTALDPASGEKQGYEQDFFGRPASLTVSGQLEAEIFAMAFRNVYTFGPTFRAENSNTPRHAAEFWMIEPEMAFADLQEDMALAEAMVKAILGDVLERCPEEMAFFDAYVEKGLLARLEAAASAEFARVTYTEAVSLLQKAPVAFAYPVEWGADLQSEHERYLTEQVFGRPVFVTDYPQAIKAFYMRRNGDGKTVAAVDLLAPGVGEIIGGSQREERLDVLRQRMVELGMEPEAYWWYLQLREYGGCPHAGFGMGFERMLLYITGMRNIRDVLPFPRTPRSAEF